VTAIIVAAGRGLRAGGGLPKQYRSLGGRAVLARTLEAFATHPQVTGLVLVIHPDDLAGPLADITLPPGTVLARGGATRDASVRAGLAAVAASADRVLIHDAARPLVSAALISRVIDALDTAPGAAPALAVTDALWRGEDGVVSGTADRAGLWRAQTPQGFRADAIRAAHAAAAAAGAAPAADDVEVARAHGLDVRIVEGEETNLKLTHASDFARAEAILAQEQQGTPMIDIRTGNGFDVHAFEPGNQVILCGVPVPHDRKLKGHSDADVGLHAITDALYGAMAAGDIGQHFPPSDPKWQGMDSAHFLLHARDMASGESFRISHVDCTLICERPKIGPHARVMRERVAELLDIDASRVSVKATTSEKLGFTGREEGIAAIATVTLVRP